MDDDGKRMSLYGKSEPNPGELDGIWKNVLSRTERITRNHLATIGDGSRHWRGIKKWSRSELDPVCTTVYDHRKRETVADVLSTYDRLFHIKYGYDSKLHRDDRGRIKTIGLSVQDEEQQRVIPVLSSSHYGSRLDKPLESFFRKHSKIEHILKGFYYRRGTGLPPCDI
ncbi:cilia- and flagella-associated protein 90-like [Mytilus galloprovincialis]|uniref:cilia- and flagella-associated protein 90-like n=1 Tax=Mytilus galloprovincialis TaxID=29158 RepID=UPI003F7C502D